eukprot:9392097-Prorocentrum_lima.AAC.1
MTSSLVGSEMCIRDRVGVEVDDQLIVHPELRYQVEIHLLYGAGGSSGCSCLLYTSDAADDM